MTFQRGCSKTNATCDTCGAEIVYPSGAFEPAPGFSCVCVARSFVFYIALGRLLFDFFCHCIVCPFSIYCSQLPLWYPQKTQVQSRDTDTIWQHKTQNEHKGTIKNGQSRDTDIIWVHKTQEENKGTINNRRSRYTDTIWVHKTQNEDAWTIKRHWHHWVYKIHYEDKGTIKNGQSRDTDTIREQKSQDKDKDAIKN